MAIHAFNDRGFDALDPKWSGGRPPTIGKQIRERICLIARMSPADWGITAFTTWSLSTLSEHLVARGTVVAISRETVRRILRDGGVSWQTTTTWKPRPTRTSSPRCTASSTSTTTRPLTVG
ncbi:helix-turn-helix domain-containing protein [Actinokineospora auranticolor]|uniref:helix-turn-helix domain-containing protein n=1 Tax=Actinokineospora auranticolor TaxID=155976 RepID=UPI001FE6D46D|nr:helix-turn-helix domain-containing protein [Actinokineospora auranticolor]